MNPQIEQDVQRLLHLPWTVLRDVTPEGDVLLRVKEVPSAVGSGDSDEDRIADLWDSLAESLRALIHFGDPVPLPDGVGQAWTRMRPTKDQVPEFYFVSGRSTSTGAAGSLVP